MLRRAKAVFFRTTSPTLTADTNPEDSRAYRPRRRRSVWRFLKRHGLVELFIVLGGICLAWLGVALGSGQI